MEVLMSLLLLIFLDFVKIFELDSSWLHLWDKISEHLNIQGKWLKKKHDIEFVLKLEHEYVYIQYVIQTGIYRKTWSKLIII